MFGKDFFQQKLAKSHLPPLCKILQWLIGPVDFNGRRNPTAVQAYLDVNPAAINAAYFRGSLHHGRLLLASLPCVSLFTAPFYNSCVLVYPSRISPEQPNPVPHSTLHYFDWPPYSQHCFYSHAGEGALTPLLLFSWLEIGKQSPPSPQPFIIWGVGEKWGGDDINSDTLETEWQTRVPGNYLAKQ